MSSLLLPPASVANSASIVHQGIATHTSPCFHYESGRSLQRSPVWVSFLSSRQASVRVERGRSAGPEHPKFSHISAAIRDELHWLPIRRRIDFKIALMVRHWLFGTAPEYLMKLCHYVGSAVGRECLRSARLLGVTSSFRGFGFRHSAIGPSLSRALKFGTLFRPGSNKRVTIYCFSNRN